MRVVIDARLYGLENAGIGRYVMNLVEQLAQIGGTNSYDIILRKKYFNQLKLPKNWTKVLFDHRHYSLAEQIILPKLIAEKKPDLVHFPHFNVPVIYRGKYVVTIHDLLMHRQKGRETSTLNPVIYYAKRMGYKKVFESAISNSARIIVPSEYVKQDLGRKYDLGANKVEVTYEGLDEKIQVRAGEDKAVMEKYKLNKRYFIYAGSAYPHKNLGRAMEAAVYLNKSLEEEGEGKMVLLAIVTSRGVFSTRLEKMTRQLGARKYVKVLGFVPDDELAGLYQGAEGFLFPSIAEGFGLPGLEAMACGTLALVSDIAVFKEIYQDKAMYFNPYDFSSIERAMRNVIEMRAEKRRKMVSEGKRFVKRYSWEKMARETLKIYNSVLK